MKQLTIVVGAVGAVLLAGCSIPGGKYDDGGETAKQGFVELVPEDGGIATASFYPSWRPQTGVCSFNTIGACTSYVCSRDAGYTGGLATVGAGTVTAVVGTQSLVLTEAASAGLYTAAANSAGMWWNGGETITVTGSGLAGGAAPFTSTLTAPALLKISNANDGGPLLVTRGSALIVTWTAGTGTVVLSLTGEWTGARCNSDAAAGALVVPSGVTQVLEVGPGLSKLSVSQSSVSRVDDWTIRVTASANDVRTTAVQ